MNETLLELCGERVDCNSLILAKAKAFAAFILDRSDTRGVWLIEARKRGDCESLVVEIRSSVGQQPRNDIRRCERLLIVFDAADRSWPSVYPLRENFPTNVAHLNVPFFGFPPTLCVSELPYEELRSRWTPHIYVSFIRRWLEGTARGDLHRPDQQLEPFLLHSTGTLIVPQRIEQCGVRIVGEQTYRLFLETDQVGTGAIAGLIFVSAPARPHGGLHALPRSLRELANIVDCDGFSLVSVVKEELLRCRLDRAKLSLLPLLVLHVPLRRAADAEAESYDVQAFMTQGTVHSMAVALDLWDRSVPEAAVLFPDPTRDGSDVLISALNVHPTLTSENLADYNGNPPSKLRYAAIGAGALGSQVLTNLARSGCFPNTVIDKDFLLPHNLARHAMFDDSTGMPKANVVTAALGGIADREEAINPVVGDILTLGGSLDERLNNQDVILDLSASVAVARYIGLDLAGSARRISMYLNPTGSDLVLLAEDTERYARLDHLEMQYYWTVASRDQFVNHLRSPEEFRYGLGCRDISARIRQSSVATLSGIGAAAVRRAAGDRGASAFIWLLDDNTGAVKRETLVARPMRSSFATGWTLLFSEDLLSDLTSRRAHKLPNETGGVLIGSLDTERKVVYLVGSVPAPPDSKEWPTGYKRGSYGLRRRLDELCKRSVGKLEYLGEWHSHPDGSTTEPSKDDHKAYEWLSDELSDEGRPAIMLIVGARDIRCLLAPNQSIIDTSMSC